MADDFNGLSFARQLQTLDGDEDLGKFNNNSNVFNNINNVNNISNVNNNISNNSAQLKLSEKRALLQQLLQSQSAKAAPSLNNTSTSDSTCLSFSLTRQYILYDTYRTGSEKKTASMIVGQSPYTLSQEAQTVASGEEIDVELEKVKELFAAGFIQQEDYITRVQSLSAQKAKAIGN